VRACGLELVDSEEDAFVGRPAVWIFPPCRRGRSVCCEGFSPPCCIQALRSIRRVEGPEGCFSVYSVFRIVKKAA
jgi:hypothetical protein